MVLKNFKPLYFLLLIIAVFGLYKSGYLGRGVEFFDGYLWYDDGLILDGSKWDGVIGVGSITSSTEGIGCTSATTGQWYQNTQCSFSSTKDFDQNDIKLFNDNLHLFI